MPGKTLEETLSEMLSATVSAQNEYAGANPKSRSLSRVCRPIRTRRHPELRKPDKIHRLPGLRFRVHRQLTGGAWGNRS